MKLLCETVACSQGRLDSATIRLMSQPRCGLPDIETSDNSQNVQRFEGIARRKKRYALRESILVTRNNAADYRADGRTD